jgi:hypothetical protein
MRLTPIQIGRNLWACVECEFRDPHPIAGIALCTRAGRDHRLLAEAGTCPENRFAAPAAGTAPQPTPPPSMAERRQLCEGCDAFGGFVETVSGFEEDGPEIVQCPACPCPLKKVNLRTGRCPRRSW